jgi:hypothetical protein
VQANGGSLIYPHGAMLYATNAWLIRRHSGRLVTRAPSHRMRDHVAATALILLGMRRLRWPSESQCWLRQPGHAEVIIRSPGQITFNVAI